MRDSTMANNNQKNTKERKILIIGRTGNGKSTLGNVITGRDSFKESEFGVSETRVHKADYCMYGDCVFKIIDTIGIGDTQLSQKDVLFRIADACLACADGIHQVLFVTSGRFTKEELEAYEILQTVLFDENIIKYTTVVRTRFPAFRNEQKRKIDIEKIKTSNEHTRYIFENCNKVIHLNNMNEDEDPDLKCRSVGQNLMLTHLYTCNELYNPFQLKELKGKIDVYKTERELIDEKVLSLSKQLKEINLSKNTIQSEKESIEKDRMRIEEERKKLDEKCKELNKKLSDEQYMKSTLESKGYTLSYKIVPKSGCAIS